METITKDKWGKDHKSMMLYIFLQCVNYGGILDLSRIRRHETKYPSILKDGKKAPKGHSDYECSDDLETYGYIVNNGTGINPIFTITDSGFEYANELFKERMENSKKHLLKEMKV